MPAGTCAASSQQTMRRWTWRMFSALFLPQSSSAHLLADMLAGGQREVRPRLCCDDAVLLQLPIAEAHIQLGAVCRQCQCRDGGAAGLRTEGRVSASDPEAGLGFRSA
jgi:hypothetical protein